MLYFCEKIRKEINTQINQVFAIMIIIWIIFCIILMAVDMVSGVAFADSNISIINIFIYIVILISMMLLILM